ncbi:hypothetical protein [Thiolapillus sp.]
MIELQKKAYIVFAALFALLAAITFWAVRENGTIYTVVPIVSLALFTLLLIAFGLARESWFDEEHFKWEELRAAVLVMLAINLGSAALLLIAAEAFHIDNTLGGLNLLRISLLIGAPIGVMVWVLLSRIFHKRNIVMLKVFLISFALLSATGASQLNRKLAGGEPLQVETVILRKERGNVGLTSFLSKKDPPLFIFIHNQGAVERLVAPEAAWSATFQNANMQLLVREGYLGYPYVSHFSGRELN